MPKYWGKQIFRLGRFPKVGQKQKTEKERKRDRKLVITKASYTMQTPPREAHTKPPGPIKNINKFNKKRTGCNLGKTKTEFDSILYFQKKIFLSYEIKKDKKNRIRNSYNNDTKNRIKKAQIS